MDRYLQLIRLAYEKALASHASYFIEAEDAIRLSEVYEDDDMAEQALQLIDHASTLAPGNDDLILRKAQILTFMGRNAEAIRLLEPYDQTDLPIALQRFDSSIASVSESEIEKMIEKLIANPFFGDDNYVEIIQILNDNQQFDLSVRYAHQFMGRIPDDTELLIEERYALLNSQKTDDAVSVCEKLIDIDPYNIEHWCELIRLHIANQQFDKAKESIDFAAAVAPNDDDVRYLRGCYLLGINRKKEAQTEFEILHEKDPDNIMVNLTIADLHFHSRDFRKAESYCLKIRSQALANADVHSAFMLSYIYLSERNLIAAEEILHDSIDHIDNLALWILIRIIQNAPQKEIEKAVERLFSEVPEPGHYLGIIYLLLKHGYHQAAHLTFPLFKEMRMGERISVKLLEMVTEIHLDNRARVNNIQRDLFVFSGEPLFDETLEEIDRGAFDNYFLKLHDEINAETNITQYLPFDYHRLQL